VRWSVLARAAREAPSTVVRPCTPLEAYLGAAADIRPLLLAGAPDLVAHVIGVEEHIARWVRGEAPDGDGDDHATVRSEAGVDRWDELVREVASTVAHVPAEAEVVAYGLPTDVEGLLVLRTFELWTHTQDLSGSVPATDPARLALMSSRLADGLPVALAVRGTRRPGRTARLVLTGVAPGCFDVPLDLDECAGEPDVTIVVDVVDACRLAARRLGVDALDVVSEGDAELGRLVLVAADTFAQD
jgi:hypothetical protein